jgi:cob(I)alamin adenosyltransferase
MAKIYTRQGDQGMTSLLGGTRLPKSHPRFHAYGTIDELNAHVGAILLQLAGPHDDLIKSSLLRIQNELFVAGGLLACDEAQWLQTIPRLTEGEISRLEVEIDHWNQSLPPLKNFILPGGTAAAIFTHIARTVCRRAERWTLDVVSESAPEFKPDYQLVLKYLNRLSDHLFTLSRWLNNRANVAETPWIPA